MTVASASSLQSGPTSSPLPKLAEPFEPKPSKDIEKTRTASGHGPVEDSDFGKKSKVRGLFGFGKKKTEESTKTPSRSDPSANLSKGGPTRRTTASPIRTDHSQPLMPSSPGRTRSGLSSSPRLASPAGSQIFERDVQEAALIPNSPAIPSHIVTEDHVPSVLDSASEAITDDHLSPDSVEIITHTGHQPAAVTVTGIRDDTSSSWQDDLAASFAAADIHNADHPDSASNYGSLDNTDIRRLSFISFADVVQAEHSGYGGIAGSRDSFHLAGLTSLPSMGGINRSPSPIRSPVSSSAGGIGTSPPNSKSGSVKGLDMSPSRRPLGSPVSTSMSMSPPIATGELNIETMSQALRRTGSSDLSGFRSNPSNPTSPVEDVPSR